MMGIKNTPKLLIAFTMLLLMTVACVPEGFAQDRVTIQEKKASYLVISEGDVVDIAFYTKSIDNGNFDRYRLIEGRRTIRFDTGFSIELLSGKELLKKYKKRINYDVIQKRGDALDYPHVFSITPEGHIIEQITMEPGKIQGKGY